MARGGRRAGGTWSPRSVTTSTSWAGATWWVLPSAKGEPKGEPKGELGSMACAIGEGHPWSSLVGLTPMNPRNQWTNRRLVGVVSPSRSGSFAETKHPGSAQACNPRIICLIWLGQTPELDGLLPPRHSMFGGLGETRQLCDVGTATSPNSSKMD